MTIATSLIFIYSKFALLVDLAIKVDITGVGEMYPAGIVAHGTFHQLFSMKIKEHIKIAQLVIIIFLILPRSYSTFDEHLNKDMCMFKISLRCTRMYRVHKSLL